MNNYRIPNKSNGWRYSIEETCGKTTTEMGAYKEGLLVAAECKMMEETSRGQEYLEANY